MKDVKESTLWKNFSKFIRARDATWQGYVSCISCSIVLPWKSVDAGHFIPVGSDSAMKYLENNVHGQCRSCNHYKSGNVIEYRFGLVRKIGEAKVKILEALHQVKVDRRPPDQFEINLLNEKYRAKFKELEKRKCL